MSGAVVGVLVSVAIAVIYGVLFYRHLTDWRLGLSSVGEALGFGGLFVMGLLWTMTAILVATKTGDVALRAGLFWTSIGALLAAGVVFLQEPSNK